MTWHDDSHNDLPFLQMLPSSLQVPVHDNMSQQACVQQTMPEIMSPCRHVISHHGIYELTFLFFFLIESSEASSSKSSSSAHATYNIRHHCMDAYDYDTHPWQHSNSNSNPNPNPNPNPNAIPIPIPTSIPSHHVTSRHVTPRPWEVMSLPSSGSSFFTLGVLGFSKASSSSSL